MSSLVTTKTFIWYAGKRSGKPLSNEADGEKLLEGVVFRRSSYSHSFYRDDEPICYVYANYIFFLPLQLLHDFLQLSLIFPGVELSHNAMDAQGISQIPAAAIKE